MDIYVMFRNWALRPTYSIKQIYKTKSEAVAALNAFVTNYPAERLEVRRNAEGFLSVYIPGKGNWDTSYWTEYLIKPLKDLTEEERKLYDHEAQ